MHTSQCFHSARWIWLKESFPNQYAAFSAPFACKDGTFMLHISADSDYAAFVDGQLWAFNQYDDFPMNKSFDSVPLSLPEGEHTLEVHVWYQGINSYQYLSGPAGVIFAVTDEQGAALTVSGEHTLCRPLTVYTQGAMEVISGQLGPAFHMDATREEAPWEQAVCVTARDATTLYPRPNQKTVLKPAIASKLAASGRYAPIDSTLASEYMLKSPFAEDGKGRYMIYDLGREEAGFLHFAVQGNKGDKVYIGWGEHMETGRVLTKIDNRNFATTYVLRDGLNEFTHYFRRVGGRYLQFMTESDATLLALTVLPTEYPVEKISDFTTPDTLLQQIYDTSVRTLHLCMHEHYEDTPWREQALYAMDSRNQALCGYCCFGEKQFPAGFLRLFQEGIRQDDLFDICAPARDKITIPSFSLSWILACRDHLLYTGDRDNARKLLPTVRRVADGFIRRIDANSGLCMMEGKGEYWNFYEWTDGMDDTRVFIEMDGSRPQVQESALNLSLILALEAAGQMHTWLGEEDPYAHLLPALRQQVKNAFYDEETGAFVTRLNEAKHFSEYNQSLALLAHLLPDDQAAALRKRLADPDNGMVPISLSCTLMKYEALMQESRYYPTVLDNIRDKWGMMLHAGATSFWEVEEGWSCYDAAGSLCHGWSAVPVYVLTRLGLGITPTAPGFTAYEQITPAFAASGKIKTENGFLQVENGKIL